MSPLQVDSPALARRILGRMAEIGVTQQDVADALGLNATQLNHILKGRRTPPADFERRVTAALDRLEKAEQAAERARAKVLRRPVKEVGGAA